MNEMFTKCGVEEKSWVVKLGRFSLILFVTFLLSIKGVAIYNVAFYLLLVAMLIYLWKKRQIPQLPDKKLLTAYIFLCACLLISGILHGEMESLKGAIGYVYRTMPFLLLYFGVSCFDRNNVVYKSFLAALFVNAGIVLYWYLQVWDRQSRLDIIDGPNLTVVVLSISLIFGLLAVYKYRYNKLVAGIGIISAIMVMLGIWWTSSRGGMMGLIVGMLVTAFCYLFAPKRARFKRPVVVSTAVILIGSLLIFGLTTYLFPRSNSDNERLCIYKSAVQMFSDHPVSGVGFYNFSKEYVNYIQPDVPVNIVFQHAHNDFLQFLSATGSVGALGFTLFSLILICSLLHRVIYNSEKNVYLAILCTIIAMYLHGLVDTVMWYNNGTRMVFGLLGAALAIGDREKE